MENDKTGSPPEPAERKPLLDMLATLEDLDENFPEIEDAPPEPVDPFSSEPSSAAPARRR